MRWNWSGGRVAGIAVLTVAVVGLGLAVAHWDQKSARSPAMSSTAAPTQGAPGPLATALDERRQWLNSPPLRPQDLRGKVVLVNFWTYSCINSLRPLPYLRAWAEKYGKRGLVIIGFHAPEFGFEKDLDNVRHATAMLGVPYPVALDSDFTAWRAFDNQGWPGFYFIDATGRVRHQKLGEGDYEESERMIQSLLAEAEGGTPADKIAEVRGEGIEAAPDWASMASPETYIGYAQARNFVSPGGMRNDAPAEYRIPSALARNQWGLAGKWTVGDEFATPGTPGAAIGYRFHARDLHLVLGAPAKGGTVRFRVTIDGAAPGADHGVDTDAEGWGTVREDRLYQLVRQKGAIADRTFRIEFSEPGARAYVFTFG